MTKFFKKPKKFDPTTEAVAKTFNKVNKKITPTEVAKFLRIHPSTAKKRIEELKKKGYLKCKLEGKKMYCERKKTIKLD